MAAKWSTFALEHTDAGLHVADPAKVLTRINLFNAQLKEQGLDHPGSLQSHTLDLQDFFTNVDREEVLEAVDFFCTALKAKFPGMDFF